MPEESKGSWSWSWIYGMSKHYLAAIVMFTFQYVHTRLGFKPRINQSDQTSNSAPTTPNQKVLVTRPGDVSIFKSYEKVTLNSTYKNEQGTGSNIPDKMPEGVDVLVAGIGTYLCGDTINDLNITSSY